MTKWQEFKLKDMCFRLSSGRNILASEVQKHGTYPVYGGNGLRGFAEKSNFKGECALIGRQGAYCGNVRFFSGSGYITEHAVVAQGCEHISTRFLAYFLSLQNLGRLSAQSAQPGLSVKQLGEEVFRVPDLQTQRKIAAVLSALDDKIENNRRICKTLEEMAQAIFKSWFVDFEPWGGVMPEGWRRGELGDVAECNPFRKLGKGVDAKCVEMSDLTVDGPFPSGWSTRRYNGGMKFRNGDTVIARITPCFENGKVGFVNFLEDDEVAFGSTEYVVISSRGMIPAEWFYCLARDPNFISYAKSRMNGSSGRQRFSASDVAEYEIPIALDEMYKKVAPLLASVMMKIKNCGFESRALASMRDALLPKLMSGEIDVEGVAV